ncbi:MAG: ATP-binding cassette domain-containing protein [Spirochaetia bacterium]|nr:ATP-binding cassette domain-containing protein [Spirochaetia bacterium]
MNNLNNSIISLENIYLNIDNKEILKNINLKVNKKETLVIMGKNGCGKTMLLKTIVGIFKPQEGLISVFNKNINSLKNRDLDELRKDIGYVFQKSGLFDSMSIAENVIFGIQRFYKKSFNELLKIATNSLNKAGLKDVENKLPSELSGGMQKRAGIARAIAIEPKILLMDDPTAGLDPVLSDAIADLILEIKESLQSTFIIVTHDFKLAYKLADRIALMVNGELKGIHTIDDFKNLDDPYFVQFREGALTGPIPVVE